MRYHTAAAGVETGRAPDLPIPELHRARGHELDETWRELIRLTVDRNRPAPEPKSWFTHFNRSEKRAASVVQLGAATHALLTAPTLPAHEAPAFITSLTALLASWVPDDAACVLEAWQHEATIEGPTNVAQGLVLRAVQVHDVGAIDAAIAETEAHIGAQWRLLLALKRQRREALAARATTMPRLRRIA